MTDPITDFLTRIKNAAMAGHQEVIIPHSKMKEAIAHLLMDTGYITGVKRDETRAHSPLVLQLKYHGRQPAVSEIRLLSTPGRRLYASVKDIPKTLGGYGITIVTTNQGVMTDTQARKANVGGELICQIW